MPETLPRRRRARHRWSLIALLPLAAFAVRSGERPELADETVTTAESTTTTEPGPPATEVATARAATIDVFPDEDADAPARQVAAGVDSSDDTIPLVFLVKARTDGDDRIEVHLPVAPAGSTGWVDVDAVTLSEVPYRVEVGLTDHRLRVLRDDEIVLDEAVGVGCDDAVAAGSVHYLTELVQPPDPEGPYGPYAYGLSGFTDVLEAVTDGDDVVAIHGTDEPELVGTDEATGCLAVDNATIERMVDDIGLPLGTPVEVDA